MKSLLNALQEGRLVELPTEDKDKCLEYLALLIEAIPGVRADMDMVKAIKEREAAASTAIGRGVACPHVRSAQEGELLCAVGWSPKGIDYGAPDKEKVHLIAMYYIPDSQKNAYLKEVSGLSRALSDTDEIKALVRIGDIQSLRSKLLNWVELSLSNVPAGAVARMIRLEEKTAKLEAFQAGTKIRAIGFSLLKTEANRFWVLSQDLQLTEMLEKDQVPLRQLETEQEKVVGIYRLVVLSARSYVLGRVYLDCVAIQSS